MRRSILRGDLEHIVLPDILSFISTLKKTGELHVRREGTEKTVFWDEGQIIFASSTHPEDSLGTFLVRNGMITQADNLRALGQVNSGQRQGKILVQMGLLQPKELWWGVRNQVLEIIYSVFLWSRGEFEFIETDGAREERIALNASTTNIILEGVRRLDEWSRMKPRLPALDARLERGRPVEDFGVELDEGELAVYKLVNGERTVYDIIVRCMLGEFETKKRLVSLLTADLIRVKEADHRHEEDVDDTDALFRVVRIYNSIFAMIYAEALRKSGGASEETRHAFEKFFEVGDGSPGNLFRGVQMDDEGKLNENVLLANVADTPVSERAALLDASLNDFLSHELFTMSKRLDPNEKNRLYRRVAQEKQKLSPE
jgi:hypothetical protein